MALGSRPQTRARPEPSGATPAAPPPTQTPSTSTTQPRTRPMHTGHRGETAEPDDRPTPCRPFRSNVCSIDDTNLVGDGWGVNLITRKCGQVSGVRWRAGWRHVSDIELALAGRGGAAVGDRGGRAVRGAGAGRGRRCRAAGRA